VRAVTIEPGRAGSLRLDDVAEPGPADGSLLARTLAVGICGTDRELISGEYGDVPPGSERLILGHESLASVVEAPPDSGFREGDLIVGIVRHPDPVPCLNCAAGEWDMCRNGRYTERGIKQSHGFAAERFRAAPGFAVRVDRRLGSCAVLLEPASVVAKAWEHVEYVGKRARWQPRRALVTGAGAVGLLAALLAAQRGLEVHVLDRAESGPKPELVRALGAAYHVGPLDRLGFEPDVIIECTGAAQLIVETLTLTLRGGIVCLTGLSSGRHRITLDINCLNRSLVLENDVVLGSVNANRRHYELAAAALAQADRSWLERVITRRVPLARWRDAYEKRPGDIKTVLEFDAA
jgi:threonine dehydrogenase-like Zn-dependent dehydrogenase